MGMKILNYCIKKRIIATLLDFNNCRTTKESTDFILPKSQPPVTLLPYVMLRYLEHLPIIYSIHVESEK